MLCSVTVVSFLSTNSGDFPTIISHLALSPQFLRRKLENPFWQNLYHFIRSGNWMQKKILYSYSIWHESLCSYVAFYKMYGPINLRMFWEIKSDTHNDTVSYIMHRNCFLEIKSCLHLCNNKNLPENGKFGKIIKHFQIS